MEYLKLAPDIDSDPDIVSAGFWGARVYELLLKVSALKDLRGRIPPKFQSSAWLARQWNLTAADVPGGNPDATIRAGVDALVSVGQLAVEGSEWVIGGWAAFYDPAKAGSERTRTWREKQRLRGDRTPASVTNGDGRDVSSSPNVTRDETPSRNVTRDACDDGDGTPHHTTHSTPPTEKRRASAPPPDLLALKAGIEAAFLKATTKPMEWGPPNGPAERAFRVLAARPHADVLERWERGLSDGFPSVATLPELVQDRWWNQLALPKQPPRAAGTGPPTKGRATNADKDWTTTPKTKLTEHGEEWDFGTGT